MNVSLPTLFVSHGSPMHAIQAGRAGDAWTALGQRLARPKAVLVASAHWETELPMVGTSGQPETIHDFGGFPQELYRIRYAAPGAPDVAARAAELLRRAGMTASTNGCRGLDHGAWVPLRRMFPDADVPVIPISIQPQLGPAHALRVGRALARLGERGLLVIASGNLTHNLRDYTEATSNGRGTPAYVREFADWMWERLAVRDLDGLLDYRRLAPHARRAHPTEEHLLPLYIALGAAGEDFEAERTHAGVDSYVLAMDAYVFTARSSPQ